jgi:hypothetical protein
MGQNIGRESMSLEILTCRKVRNRNFSIQLG